MTGNILQVAGTDAAARNGGNLRMRCPICGTAVRLKVTEECGSMKFERECHECGAYEMVRVLDGETPIGIVGVYP